MKKWSLVLVCLLVILLVSCKKDEAIKMMVPYGSPQFSQLYMQDDKDYAVDIVMGPDPLVAAFGSHSHDVIFAPINLGAKLYLSKPDYKLLAVITWGNYYLVSSSPIESVNDLLNQTIVVFGQNQISDMLIQQIDAFYHLGLTINYVDSLATATAHALLHPSDFVLVAEPSLSQLVDGNDTLNYLDLQLLYQEMTGLTSMPQAGVFVKSNLSDAMKDKISKDLEDSIEKLFEDTYRSAELAKQLGIDLDLSILESSFTFSHLNFVLASDAKDDVETFFDYILDFLPQMIGNDKPDASFYED